MQLPRETVLYVLREYGVEVECDTPMLDGRALCTLSADDVIECQWLPDPVMGLMVRYLARKFGIPTHAFYFDITQDVGPPRHH